MRPCPKYQKRREITQKEQRPEDKQKLFHSLNKEIGTRKIIITDIAIQILISTIQ